MARNYRELHEKVVARPGAPERLAALREATVAEIGLHELRRALNRSQAELALSLGNSQPAVSQLERGEDIRLSSLRRYLEGLGARLRIVALFDDGETETAVPLRIGGGNSLVVAEEEADYDASPPRSGGEVAREEGD
ncbi:MAG: helix-turn-helix transcriptional regulator [Chloroflexi bacterium]|nr:helix-turn-helix transcriptional regulator [Chloroflexota bacterium]MYI81831.1 helix-turn-helix transcriptional regulator [Chloroflexota bacterium]